MKIIQRSKISRLTAKARSARVSRPISVVSANGVNTQFFNADLKLEVRRALPRMGTSAWISTLQRTNLTSDRPLPMARPIQRRADLLLVHDGDTTVIGGVYTRNTGSSSAQVPFISKIPILGWFFQNHKESDKRSELLIFITRGSPIKRAVWLIAGRSNVHEGGLSHRRW